MCYLPIPLEQVTLLTTEELISSYGVALDIKLGSKVPHCGRGGGEGEGHEVTVMMQRCEARRRA